MKRALLTVATALIAVPAISSVTVPTSDSRITYVGRTLAEGDDVSFDWSSTYAKISFQGDNLTVRASDTGKDYFNVWIDREMSAEADKVLCISTKDTLLAIVTAADFKKARKQATHTVIIQKRTEADQGRTTFHSFTAGNGLQQAAPVKERLTIWLWLIQRRVCCNSCRNLSTCSRGSCRCQAEASPHIRSADI